mmetsp:Transcript_63493/g.112929  ORF Transcript_63493/g.112929 Transcript_63493/m.112929 type:complete len:440 (-) Transcript_63493:27-1346(-)
MGTPLGISWKGVRHLLKRRVAELHVLSRQGRFRLSELRPSCNTPRHGSLEAHVIAPGMMKSWHLVCRWAFRLILRQCSHYFRNFFSSNDCIQGSLCTDQLLPQAFPGIEMPSNITAEGCERLQDLGWQGSLPAQLHEIWVSIKEPWEATFVQLVPHTTLVQKPLESTSLHHVGVLEICQLVGEDRTILVRPSCLHSCLQHIGHTIRSLCHDFSLRQGLLELHRGKTLVVVCFPAVLNDGLLSIAVVKLLFFSVIHVILLFVTCVEEGEVASLSTFSRNVCSSIFEMLLTYFYVELLEGLSVQGRLHSGFQDPTLVEEVRSSRTGVSWKVQEHPAQLLLGLFFWVWSFFPWRWPCCSHLRLLQLLLPLFKSLSLSPELGAIRSLSLRFSPSQPGKTQKASKAARTQMPEHACQPDYLTHLGPHRVYDTAPDGAMSKIVPW